MEGFIDLDGIIDTDVYLSDVFDRISDEDLFTEISDRFYRYNHIYVDKLYSIFADTFIDTEDMIPIAKQLIIALSDKINSMSKP